MGVNGLWTVVQPCARPTNLATLNRKRLAVDASIWIYQFLKAVRDKEGNALRNSHVVGFFRRICKLLWFGIQPVFVFDGGAPALKRATILQRKRRREGRREDAVKTAGKLLAVQMHRLAEEEEERRKRETRDRHPKEPPEEVIPDVSSLVYVDEIGMSQQERLRRRRFYKQDAYHLPELDGGIAAMVKPDDPRIMSVEELEEYARQFNNGEDINLYDFSKIDFDGDFFKSLPAPDRYNILNAARLRSRLRMGLSKEQLDDMFPDRMAFSRFQIERVRERNHLTQRLMMEVGMGGTDLTLGVNARIAGEKDREYILVKNEGVEGGWALGVVSKDKDIGEAHKPIDVDAIQVQYQAKDEESEEDEDFEDVPIEGVNRLPRPSALAESIDAQQFDADLEESLFVGGNAESMEGLLGESSTEQLHPDEDHDLNTAIALSLQNQFAISRDSEEKDSVESKKPPAWTQMASTSQRPIQGSGSMIAHIVNNRANASVASRQASRPTAESDSENDELSVMASLRLPKKPRQNPVLENKKNPFDGPLPFPKLDWESSLFAKAKPRDAEVAPVSKVEDTTMAQDEDETQGGFMVKPQQEDEPKPLPPWLADETDIRQALRNQQDVEREINAEDRADAEEEARLLRKEMEDGAISIDSSSDDGSDVQVIEIPHSPEGEASSPKETEEDQEDQEDQRDQETQEDQQDIREGNEVGNRGGRFGTGTSPFGPGGDGDTLMKPNIDEAQPSTPSVTLAPVTESQMDEESPEPDFEDVIPEVGAIQETNLSGETPFLEEPTATGLQDATQQGPSTVLADDDDMFGDVDDDEFSDPGDEELLAQMAEEAEGHAQFASELNNKTAQQNREEYEKELKALRSQQKKDRRDADEVTQIMIEECQALLRLFGIPYITAPMEAEAQCAELVRLNMVDGIVTDDSDTFLFGGTRVYKNMFNGNKFVECYLGPDLEKEMSLSREQLVSLALLLGSDYTEGLPGVGPVTAVEILSEFPGRDGLQEFREWWTAVQSQSRPKEADAASAFRRKFRKSQGTKLFLPPGFPSPAVYDAYLRPEVDSSRESFQWGVPDVEGLRRFLMATIGWGKERTDEVLVPVIRDMNKREAEGTQSNITRFFGGAVGVGAAEAFAPRQRVQGSKRMAAAVDRLRAGGKPLEEEDGTKTKRRRSKR